MHSFPRPSYALLLPILLSTYPAAPAAAAELYKCRSADGPVLYSDVPCEKAGAKPIGTVTIAPGPASSAPRPSGPGAIAGPGGRAPESKNTGPKDPEARQRREAELKAVLDNPGSSLEQKAAAQEELASIPALGVCKLSEEQRGNRDGAFSELGGERAGRLKARRALRDILSTCERI